MTIATQTAGTQSSCLVGNQSASSATSVRLRYVLRRSFFGKNNCLTIMMNASNEFYIHLGVKKAQGWAWTKLKMSDHELADILLVIKGVKENTSFFHKFGDSSSQMWLRKADNCLFVKVPDVSKQLNQTEMEVLRILLEYSIFLMNKPLL